MSKQAMKLALEALEGLEALLLSMGLTHLIVYGDAEKAITNLQKELANEALNKMAQNAKELGLDYESAQQEPVAWMHWLHGPVRLFLNKDEAMMELDRLNREYPVDADGRKMRPLVFGDTSPQPAQRTWVGLTEEERIMCRSYDPEEAVAKTEAKLKEKNT